MSSGGKAGGARRVAILGLLAMGIAADAHATDPLLRRTPGSWLYGPETVWTDGNAGSGYLFHPLSEATATAGLHYVRVAYQLSQDSGNCQLRPAVRFSDDGINWDAAVDVHSTWQNGNDVTYPAGFEDILNLGTDPKAWVQFGVQTDNDVGISTILSARRRSG
ncbi:MAG TPA: hypothetical protein PLA94_26580 [Myxococcota bacterium]|nr:hypothetical protein [Myxococcota bacterium]